MKKTVATVLLVFCVIGFSNLMADELLIQGIENEPPNSLEGVPRPKPGMSMQKVQEIFGKPKTKSQSVGTPPITRWTYDKFVVVFEDQYVVNSVVRKPAAEGFANSGE